MSSTITRFDGFTINQLRRKLDEAMDLVEEELGIRIVVGNIRYHQRQCSIKVQAMVENAVDAMHTDDRMMWNNNCRRYGFEPSDHGAVFKSPASGDMMKIETLRTSNHKYPIICSKVNLYGQRIGDKRYKISAKLVRQGLNEAR